MVRFKFKEGNCLFLKTVCLTEEIFLQDDWSVIAGNATLLFLALAVAVPYGHVIPSSLPRSTRDCNTADRVVPS